MSTTTTPETQAPAGRAAASDLPRRRGSRARLFGLLVVTALSLGIVGYAIAVYGGFDPARSVLALRNTTWHYALLQGHIITGGVALALGPFQFFRRIRAKRPHVHRWIGRTYLFAGVFPSAFIGIPVALLSVEGPWASAGLLVGDISWFITGVIAYRYARRRRYREHGKWMTWNFALTFAAVTFRIWLGLLIAVQVPFLRSWYGGDFGALFTVAYSTTTWLAFLPNIAIMVLVQRLVRARRRGHATDATMHTARQPKKTTALNNM